MMDEEDVMESMRKRIMWINWMMLGLIVLVYVIGYLKITCP